MTRPGWQRRRRSPSGLGYALVGVLLTLFIVLVVAVVVVLNGSGGSATATPSPSPAPTQVALATAGSTASPEPALPTPTAEITAEPTAQPTAQPTPSASPAPAESLAPGQTLKPTLTAFSGPHQASCTLPNGVAAAGYVHLTWSAVDVTGVRISIDPPTPAQAYDYGYADYPWPAVGSADLPFACGAASHLYVVTTAHTTGYYQYRYIKITAAAP